MMASQKGHVEVVDRLLQCGARVDLQTKVHFIVKTAVNSTYIHTLY